MCCIHDCVFDEIQTRHGSMETCRWWISYQGRQRHTSYVDWLPPGVKFTRTTPPCRAGVVFLLGTTPGLRWKESTRQFTARTWGIFAALLLQGLPFPIKIEGIFPISFHYLELGALAVCGHTISLLLCVLCGASSTRKKRSGSSSTASQDLLCSGAIFIWEHTAVLHVPLLLSEFPSGENSVWMKSEWKMNDFIEQSFGKICFFLLFPIQSWIQDSIFLPQY